MKIAEAKAAIAGVMTSKKLPSKNSGKTTMQRNDPKIRKVAKSIDPSDNSPLIINTSSSPSPTSDLTTLTVD